MSKTIEELWNGSISPGDNCGVGDMEIEILAMLMEQQQDALCQSLPPQQQVCFQNYTKFAEKYCTRLSFHAFRDGFCLAAKLMTESLT